MDKGAWTRLILLLAALVNSFLAAHGYDTIKLDEATVSLIITAIIALIGLWKDNPFTKKAQQRKKLNKAIETKREI